MSYLKVKYELSLPTEKLCVQIIIILRYISEWYTLQTLTQLFFFYRTDGEGTIASYVLCWSYPRTEWILKCIFKKYCLFVWQRWWKTEWQRWRYTENVNRFTSQIRATTGADLRLKLESEIQSKSPTTSLTDELKSLPKETAASSTSLVFGKEDLCMQKYETRHRTLYKINSQ